MPEAVKTEELRKRALAARREFPATDDAFARVRATLVVRLFETAQGQAPERERLYQTVQGEARPREARAKWSSGPFRAPNAASTSERRGPSRSIWRERQ
jgi:hypothetical protein